MSSGARSPGSVGRAAPSALPRVGAVILVAMALVVWLDVVFRSRLAGVIGSSGYSATAGVVISAVALPIAMGLWLRSRWAWWAALIAAAWQLTSHLLYIVVTTASGDTVGAAGWLIGALLVLFLVVQLLPANRETCLRRESQDQP